MVHTFVAKRLASDTKDVAFFRDVTSRRHVLRTVVGASATIGIHALFGASTAAARGGAGPTRAPFADPGRRNGESVVIGWNKAALQAVRATRMGPPMVARALAILHTCIYDAWAVYNDRALGTRLGAVLRQTGRRDTQTASVEAISYAAYCALVDLFPAQVDTFKAYMVDLGFDPAASGSSLHTPRGIGTLVARLLLAYCHGDGANQLGDRSPGAYTDYTDYQPANDPDTVRHPDRWQPLRIPDGQGGSVVQRYLVPYWGLVRPFALSSSSQFRPSSGPALYSSDRYLAQAQQIIDLNAQLTDQQKMIAEYWADGPATETPPGHWNLLAHVVSARAGHDLDQDVTLFFALNNALFDASIAAWDAKRTFDYVRPITAIRAVYAGRQVRGWGGPFKGTQAIDGKDWHPYQRATFPTPPFAEFVSGHSTFSAAAAEILRRFTGSDAFGMRVTLPAGSSGIEPGAVPAVDITLSWDTFSAAADEAGMSRRYGGIHFEDGDLAGRTLGRRVGAQVWDKAQAYITGAA